MTLFMLHLSLYLTTQDRIEQDTFGFLVFLRTAVGSSDGCNPCMARTKTCTIAVRDSVSVAIQPIVGVPQLLVFPTGLLCGSPAWSVARAYDS